MNRHCIICPVCGKYRFKFEYDVCEVCGWENDGLQFIEPDYEGGANKLSLNEYRKQWLEKNKGE